MSDDEEDEKAEEVIICRNCGCKHFRVVWVRQRRRGKVRALNCRNCGRRTTTVEKEETEE